jgi:hypothetical protein
MDDGHGEEQNRPRIAVMPPADRHFIARIRKSILAAEWTTFIVPGVNVDTDVMDIVAGRARREGNLFHIRGRVYQMKPTGRLFPVSGDGFVGPVPRPVVICLRAYARYNGVNDLAAYEIRRQEIADEHVRQAQDIWALKERGNP